MVDSSKLVFYLFCMPLDIFFFSFPNNILIELFFLLIACFDIFIFLLTMIFTIFFANPILQHDIMNFFYAS
jgi:hypothetical protein